MRGNQILLSRFGGPAAVLCFLALAPAPAAAQAQDTASVSIKADLLGADLAIARESDINLGTILRPSSGVYTVTLGPGGARGGSGGTGGAVIGGPGQTATFTVSGAANRDFLITTPSTVTLVTGAGGANRELAFTPAHASSGNTGAGEGGVGATEIEVHGALAIPATAETGAYAATMPVTVQYQ